MKITNRNFLHRATGVAVLSFGMATTADAAVVYYNGFETDTAGWNVFGGSLNANRVASGTNGITSASGTWHAQNATASAGNWGGYGFNPGCASTACAAAAFPAGGYVTSIDIYLDVGGGWTDNTRFDFSSAVSQQSGSHRRDFIFNGAFFSSGDLTGPGAGTDRFIFSASNNSQPGSAYAKNPGRSPIAIGTSGWYTFQHTFYDNGLGQLAVDMSILDSSSNLVNTWTLSDPTDLIASVIGGNRYGWFDYNEFSVLAFDNASLSTAVVPVPAAVWFLGSALGLLGWVRRRAADFPRTT